MYFKLKVSDYPTVDEAFASIPEGVTSLDLGGNSFCLALPKNINALMKFMGLEKSKSINWLGLSNTSINIFSPEILTSFMGAIHENVTSLDLSENNLGLMGVGNFALLMDKTPAKITSLNLSGNSLWGSYPLYRTPQETLVAMMEAIPETVTILDLSDNGLFSNMLVEKFMAIMRAIPKTVTSLDLSRDSLNGKNLQELQRIFEITPPNITSLHLHGIVISDHFKEAISVINPNIKSLHLGWDFLIPGGHDESKETFSFIPESVTSLQLTMVPWHSSDEAAMQKFCSTRRRKALQPCFSSIPINITSLDLSGSYLGQMSAQDLQLMLQAIPEHVTSINLRNNGLFENKSPEAIDAFLKELGDVRFRQGLDLSHNGESEFSRVAGPLVLMGDQLEVDTGSKLENVPFEVLGKIASFACRVPEGQPSLAIEKGIKSLVERKEHEAYINNPTPFPPGVIIQPSGEEVLLKNESMDIDVSDEHDVNGVEEEKVGDVAPLGAGAENERDAQAVSWMQFICEIPSMPAIQLASIALGAVILLSCSSIGMLALGTGLTLFGGVVLAKNMYDAISVAPEVNAAPS